MVNRFEIWPPSQLTHTVADEASDVAEKLKMQAAQVGNQIQTSIVQRPALTLAMAFCAGTVLGWFIKRR